MTQATTPTLHNQTGLSVLVHLPLIAGGEYMFSLRNQLRSYSHAIDSFGGYKSAAMEMSGRQSDLDGWLQDGLGRHIEVYDSDGIEVWEGFVNKVTLNLGAVSITRGPLMGLTNLTLALYVPIIDNTVNPPLLGSRTETTFANDRASYEKYGIVEKYLNLGNCFDDEAEYIRDTYLAENKEPETTHTLNIGGGGNEPTVSLECAGYYEWLDVAVEYSLAAPTSITVSTKIGNMITFENTLANGFLSADQSGIAFNGVLTTDYESEYRTYLTIIKNCVARGDINGTRWLFGVYNGRKAYYQEIPDTASYLFRTMGSSVQIETPDHITLEPWGVRAGKWLFMPDIMTGFSKNTEDLNTDPRAMFIESVQYTAPWSLTVNGWRVNTLSQRLARLGLGGIS